jgi:AraC-like DNA-binding protein
MLIHRIPAPPLRPFVSVLWASTEMKARRAGCLDRERVLPTGAMHLVFRLSDHPLRVFDPGDAPGGRTVGHAVVGGARATFYIRDVSQPVRSIGAQLRPGAARLLFGASANEFAGRHTPLEALWGRFAEETRERLALAASPRQQLALFEHLLASRIGTGTRLHPCVAHALDRLAGDGQIHRIVEESGYSHRHWVGLFREGVGLAPKVYRRILRFRAAVDRLAADTTVSLADLAHAAGYSDQPHFNREFREFAGVSPGQYRALLPDLRSHVAIQANAA